MRRLFSQFLMLLLITFAFCLIEIKAIPESPQDISLRPKLEYTTEGARDPFQPPRKNKEIKQDMPISAAPQPVEKIPLPPLTVSGIVWGGVFPQAIINDRVVKPGDNIGEVNIVAISKDGITVSFANRIYNLSSPAGGDLKDEKKRQ